MLETMNFQPWNSEFQGWKFLTVSLKYSSKVVSFDVYAVENTQHLSVGNVRNAGKQSKARQP